MLIRGNSSEIVMAQKQIWSSIPLFPVLVMFFIYCLAETNRAPFDLLEGEAESVVGVVITHHSLTTSNQVPPRHRALFHH
ncbi:putative NADH:ubiquinone reductase (H(+)-translocating) [Helianthus anomalus]